MFTALPTIKVRLSRKRWTGAIELGEVNSRGLGFIESQAQFVDSASLAQFEYGS